MVCTKKNFSGQMGHSGPENGISFFYQLFFEKKNHLGQFDIFIQPLSHFLLFDWDGQHRASPLLIRFLNSQDMISFIITTGPLNSQDIIRILKQSRHGFSGKHVMDIVWILCDAYVWRSKFMVLQSFFNNLLHKFV